MRVAALTASVVLVLAGFVPAAGAFHLSIGNHESAAQSEETRASPTVTPGAEDVRGKNPDNVQPATEAEGGTLYQRGLVTDGCYEAEGTIQGAPGEVQEAAPQDPICGRLVYNQDSAFTARSPLDQDIRQDGWEFDVVFSHYVGAFSLSFNPFPNEDSYRAIHEVGSTNFPVVGPLTDDGDTAQNGDQGVQTFSPNVMYPQATTAATQASGLYEGNGWLFPVPDLSMVGFLEDEDGNEIGDEALATEVSALQDNGQLPDSAIANVCGFTPDDTITIDAPQVGFCEVVFEYNGQENPADANGGDFQPEAGDYTNPCESPTYVCGVTGGAWYAQKVCNVGGSEECPTNPGTCQRLPSAAVCVEQLEAGDGFESTRDYDIWHWVAAPAPPAQCSTLVEPGFRTSAVDAQNPYLAHDLDIYVTPTGPAPADETRGTESLEEYLVTTVEETRESGPGVDTGPVEDEVDTATAQVARDDRVEPNADGDTSQSLQFGRTLGANPCEALFENDETAQTKDPWVNIVDSTVFRAQSGDVSPGIVGDSIDLYLNEDQNQDASNRPGPYLYDTTGMAGLFTDRNDDGDYDQVGPNDLFDEIVQTGAYPTFFDMRVDEDTGETVPEEGCTQGFARKTLTEQMDNAGYGPHTGLIQVLYLSHPTVLLSQRSQQEVVVVDRPNVPIVFLSTGLRDLRDFEDGRPGDNDVQEAIDAAIERLPGDVSADPIFPGDRVTPDSDFDDGCGEATGGFDLDWNFVHAAQAGAGGDTIVTEYLWENEATGGVLGGNGDIPTFQVDGQDQALPTGINAWFDVDPLDNDPGRNSDQSSAPPQG